MAIVARATPIEDAAVKVSVASSRPAVVAAWLARLANDPRVQPAGAIVFDAQTLHTCLADAGSAVVLLDVASVEWLDARALRTLQAASVRVLLTCDHAGPQLAELVLSHGFHGYLVAHEHMDLCVKAILTVHRGELWLPRSVLAEALNRRLGDRAAESPPVSKPCRPVRRGPLTERERQVVDCVRKGSSNSEIAHELGIKKDTVKKHLRHAFGKLGVQRRTEIAARGHSR